MKNLFLKLLSGIFIVLLLNVANASTMITVDYQFMNEGYSDISGSFSGIDSNNDKWLVFSELSDWSISLNGGYSFADLNDLGDFNYDTNTWVPNARHWDGVTQDAYMTWNNWNYSVSTSAYNWSIATTIRNVDNPVPEPSTMLLFGLGILGLAGVSRKKTA